MARLAILLAIAALAALPAAASADVLLDQMNNDSTNGIISQNFQAPYDSHDTQAADDFGVPAESQGWNIGEVDVTGNPAFADPTDVTVFVYADSSGLPGASPAFTQTVVPTSAAGSGNYVLPLSPTAHLEPGTYWVSVVSNASESSTDAWSWEERDVQAGSVWAFMNPGGFFNSCTAWTSSTTCYGPGSPDLMFRLKGSPVFTPPPPTPPPPEPPASPPPPSGSATDTTPPVQTATAPRAESVKKGYLFVTVTETEDSTDTVSGSVTVPNLAKAYRLAPVTKAVRANTPTRIRIKLPSKALKAARLALARHRTPKARLSIVAKDAAGNAATTRKSFRLKR